MRHRFEANETWVPRHLDSTDFSAYVPSLRQS